MKYNDKWAISEFEPKTDVLWVQPGQDEEDEGIKINAFVNGKWRAVSGNGGENYPPEDGIPVTDLDNDVQTSLGKADTALQTIKTVNGQSLVGSGDIEILEPGTIETLVIDGTPTAGSSNLITSGGVASEIVWDVTARNSNTTFASLSALLSNANLATLIPTTIRKGGMQIRFVCSSDNKYVQCRYMQSDASTVATFINVANWQGVDGVPTAESDNLVTSGGTAKELQFTNDDIGEKVTSMTFESAGEKPYYVEPETYIVENTGNGQFTISFRETQTGTSHIITTVPKGISKEIVIDDYYNWIRLGAAGSLTIRKKESVIARINEVNGKLGNYAALIEGTEILSNSNLNTYTTSGTFYVGGSAIATLQNRPTNNVFKMFVLQTSQANGSRIQVVNDTAGSLFIRTYNGSTWSSWKTYATTAYIDEFKGICMIMSGGTELTNGQDLDSFTTVGTFFAGGGVAATLLHCPTQSVAFRMFVLQSTDTNTGRVQIIVDILGNVFKRKTNGSTFTDWQKLATTDEVDALKNTSFLLVSGTEIQSNSDLNDLKTVGTYFTRSITNGLSNTPAFANTVFKLAVLQPFDTSGDRVQIVIDRLGTVFIRSFVANAWSAWKSDVNVDEELMIQAASNYGRSGYGELNKYKNFSMLITTDVHASSGLFDRAIAKLNTEPAIDAGICLGDIPLQHYNEDVDWYVNAVNKSNKPFFTVIGNHDGGNNTSTTQSGTKQQVFDKFIQPTLSKIGIVDLTKTYYRKDFADYKLSLIVLDNYDAPDTVINGEFAVSRGVECFSQAQIDWFVNQLQTIPNDYHLLIARHSGAGASWTVDADSLWTNPTDAEIEASEMAYAELPINDIVNAWKNGTSLTKSYLPTSYTDYLPTLSVSADFTSRGIGVFVCYIVGHHHADVVAEDANGQKIFELDCTALDTYMNFRSDLPRMANTVSQDLLTLIGVNTTDRVIKLVRIGSHITTNMRNRDVLCVSY